MSRYTAFLLLAFRIAFSHKAHCQSAALSGSRAAFAGKGADDAMDMDLTFSAEGQSGAGND